MPRSEVYSEPSQTSKMQFFAKIVEDFESLIIFVKCSISDVQLGSEYTYEVSNGCIGD